MESWMAISVLFLLDWLVNSPASGWFRLAVNSNTLHNYLATLLTKTVILCLKWDIHVALICIGTYLEGTEESVEYVNFYYYCNLCRDAMPI